MSWRVTIKSDTIRKQSSQVHGVHSCTWGLYPVEYTGVTIKYAFYGSCFRRKDQGLMEPMELKNHKLTDCFGFRLSG